MKKALYTILITLGVSLSGYAQSIFDKFENNNEVTSLIVTKNMFKLMSKIDLSSSDPEAKEYLQLVENLENIKVFTTANTSVAAEMKKTVDSYLSSGKKMSELMRINDDGVVIRFYVQEGKNENFVKELFMYLEDPKSTDSKAVVMSITGNIDLRQVSKLTSELNVPGSENLKDIKKNN